MMYLWKDSTRLLTWHRYRYGRIRCLNGFIGVDEQKVLGLTLKVECCLESGCLQQKNSHKKAFAFQASILILRRLFFVQP